MVKVKTSEGLVARLLMVGIVRIVPRNKLIDQGLFHKIASARGIPRWAACWAGLLHAPAFHVGPTRAAEPNACHRPFLFSKAFSNLVSKVNL